MKNPTSDAAAVSSEAFYIPEIKQYVYVPFEYTEVRNYATTEQICTDAGMHIPTVEEARASEPYHSNFLVYTYGCY